jgi:hypothetical protein
MKILIGADPEVFMFKDGKPVSAHGAIKGTKHEPYKVKNGAVQVDGMALEFNIDPAETADAFVNNIDIVMNQLALMVPGHELHADPVAEFTAEYMKAQPKEALELGCEPDYNAYTGKANARPNNKVLFRTGAGHIHIGWCEDVDKNDPAHIETCKMLVKEMDYAVGLGSLLYDNNGVRRKLYGKAGAYRPKNYGVEYRVLSNVWLRSPELMRWVFDNTQAAFNRLVEGKSIMHQKYGMHAATYINSNDVEGASLYLKASGYAFPPGV